MVTKEDLIFVRDFTFRKRERERVLDQLREKVDVHGIQYDKISVGGGDQHDRMAEHAAAVDALERRIQQETAEDNARYVRITEEILRLPPKEMEVIRLRYMEVHSWGWIRKHMHYERSQVFRIHASALAILSKDGTK